MSTSIEWTDETWNPVVGCDRVSPGCDGCYAIGVAHRKMQPAHEGLTIHRPGERTDWTGVVRCLPDRLGIPARWRRPRKVFVNSMSDLFHPEVPEAFIRDVFDVMAAERRHSFQVLTKRPKRMELLTHDRLATPTEVDEGYELGIVPSLWDICNGGNPAPNVWLGTSIETVRYAWRADALRRTDAAVKFLSLEPLLGPMDDLDLTGIDWVIVGGESGPGARPMHPDWVRTIRDRCSWEGIPFLFKQWGEWYPADQEQDVGDAESLGAYFAGPRTTRIGDATLWRAGKKEAGRHLDGRTHDDYPVAVVDVPTGGLL